MTLNEFFQVQGRTFRRAREWQVHFNEQAKLIDGLGLDDQAARLRAIGERAWPIADRVVTAAFEKVGEPLDKRDGKPVLLVNLAA